MSTQAQIIVIRVRAELHRLRHDDGGYSTEAVVVTALLAALALAVIAILMAKVLEKANGITL
jgi:hypothetical protein